MFARLTALVSSGNSLPFELGESFLSSWGPWSHFQGTLKADGSSCSVFRVSSNNPNDHRLIAARNGVRRLRTFRHPHILSFKDMVEIDERGETAIYLITEAVTPLPVVLESIALHEQEREQYVRMGLHQVSSALSFLNNDCKVIHGGLSSSAVLVTDSLDWKLHGFDLVTDHQWQGDCPMAAAQWAVAAQYKPGEIARCDWPSLRDSPPWSVDIWGLGCLIQEVYSGRLLKRTENLRETDSIPKDLLPYYQKMLASSPDRRLNPSKLLESGVLRNRLVDIVQFLDNLALKESEEKDAFFKRLSSSLSSIPPPVAQRKLLPALAGALEFGGAPSVALTTLIAIGEGLTPEERTKRIVPVISKLFASQDRGIRRSLLENISSFGPSLPDALVEEHIFADVSSGFTDTNPYMRELTLKSMIVLGPKLSQKALNQGLLKHLARLQVDEEASIRANTTVLLGNLATYLPETTAKKILLNAFSRAMKDPFPPARVAAVRAVVLTSKYHSPEDVSQRILPSIAPLCCDPVHEVRNSALDCLDHFTKVLKDHSRELDKKQIIASSGGSSQDLKTGGSSPAQAAGSAGGASMLTSFGWAVSSLGLGAATGQQSGSRPADISVSNSKIQGFGSNSVQPPAMQAQAQQQYQAPVITNTTTLIDGWDNDDVEDLLGLEDVASNAMHDELQARQRLSAQSKSQASESARAPVKSNTSVGWDTMKVPTVTAPKQQPMRPRPTVSAGASRKGGMKLGASKLGASKAKVEEDFTEW